ncbi:MAG: hypothetical protein ACRC51_03950 [Cetobacterium sp.]
MIKNVYKKIKTVWGGAIMIVLAIKLNININIIPVQGKENISNSSIEYNFRKTEIHVKDFQLEIVITEHNLKIN